MRFTQGETVVAKMSEVNQCTLGQVLGQSEPQGAMVRRGSDQLKVWFVELGPHTVEIHNLQGQNDELFMHVAIRYQSGADTYDALVSHVTRAENGMDLIERHELIDGLYFDQFPELVSGAYCGDQGNGVLEEQARAWLAEETPSLVIFSAGEQARSGAGFWTNDDGWTEHIRDATRFSEYERKGIADYRMPVTPEGDAAWVIALNYDKPSPKKNARLSSPGM